MEAGKYEYQSNFAKKYIALGREEGKAEGKAEGEGRALLAVLRGRGFTVSEAVQKKVESCTDLALLERWIVRALSAKSAEEAVEEAAPKTPSSKTPRKKTTTKAPRKK